ncbi:MAG: type VI secretion system baseplate subunit TssG [Aquisalimonadaceae bacterium]
MTLPERLRLAPERFTLFAALRLIEAAAPERPRLGRSRRAAEDAVRLAQLPALRFAPGEISRIVEGPVPTLYGEGFGLLGPNGPLPLHLTEYADERRRQHQDPSFADFLNLFHHRMASLFYRAWADAEPSIEAERKDDRFSWYLGALMGLGTPGVRGRDGVGDRARLHRTGRFAALPRCREGLEDILADHFELPVHIVPFRPSWLDIPPEQRLQLGRRSAVGVLGRDANLGRRSWQCQFSFRIVISQLSRQQFTTFLPGQPALSDLEDLVRGYLGDELRWDLELQLQPGQAPPLRLSRGIALGWSSWLGRRRRDKALVRIRDAHTRQTGSRRKNRQLPQGGVNRG